MCMCCPACSQLQLQPCMHGLYIAMDPLREAYINSIVDLSAQLVATICRGHQPERYTGVYTIDAYFPSGMYAAPRDSCALSVACRDPSGVSVLDTLSSACSRFILRMRLSRTFCDGMRPWNL